MDIDDSERVEIDNVEANGNGGSGYQTTVTDVAASLVKIKQSVFDGNGRHGVEIVEAGTTCQD